MRVPTCVLAVLSIIASFPSVHAAVADTRRRAEACRILETVRREEGLPGLTAAVAAPSGAIVEFGAGHAAGNGGPMPPDEHGHPI